MDMESTMEKNSLLNTTTQAVWQECFTSMQNWPSFNSAHEGYGVLTEEYRELEAHVFMNQKKRNIDEMRKEAIQTAAMALRFAVEVCNETVGRK